MFFIYKVYSLSKLSELFSFILAIKKVIIIVEVRKIGIIAIRVNIEIEKNSVIGIEINIMGNKVFLESDTSGLSNLMSISTALYFLLYESLSFILFVNLEALMT